MKLTEIKENTAIKHGYDNFEQIITACDLDKLSGNTMEDVLNDCMREYAKQMCIEQRELCASHAKLLHHDGRSKKDKVLSSRIYIMGCDNLMIYKESITKAPLVI